jgi:Family of unknown function (DUF5682)
MSNPATILGIRHHGPGSARAVAGALDALKPDRLLIEGPPDADDVIAFAAQSSMEPPVAILVYDAADPKNAVYYPFARFSPEWVAIRWALQNGVPIRFMDLPQSHRLATEPTEVDLKAEVESWVPGDDPIGMLARAAGYEDGERWWEHVVEHRRDQPVETFDAIAQAMTTLREDETTSRAPDEPRREAWMRKTIREELKAGAERLAVVCGAWHAPVLTAEKIKESKKNDDAILKGLEKVKTVATWVPWTYGRLTFASGYGAGVRSPGWYDHLWTCENHTLERWLTRVARLLRDKDIDCSSAHVIEATRLARGLAGLRGRPIADLADISDATRAIFCYDSDLPMRLIATDLLVGDRIGEVPSDTPMVPLQSDLLAEQKRLRLKPAALEQNLELDLRTPIDLDRSRLLHRLRLLNIPWGEPRGSSGKGTFKEWWVLRWQPEFLVVLVEKGAAGNTVAAAAAATIAEAARTSDDLRSLAGRVSDVVLADLPGALDAVLNRIAVVAAVAADLAALMDAVGPLAAVKRYGSVRQTDSEFVSRTLDGLLPRICVGLAAMVASLDDDAATEADRRILAVNDAVQLLESESHTEAWRASLAHIVASPSVHGLVRGGAARRLFDAGSFTADEIGTQMSQALSPGSDLAHAAAWLEGFFRGSGLLLLHDERLLKLVDEWVRTVPAGRFDDFLPLVRRTFSTFPRPERRQIGQQLTRARSSDVDPTTKQTAEERIDLERARRVLPLLRRLLGGPA